MSGIRTNKAIAHFNFQKLDERYDIFCLETSRKFINSGAKIIDAPLLNKNVRAVLFENGKRFYVLLNHSSDNCSIMKEVLSDEEYGGSMSITQKKSSELGEYQLLQLLINGLAVKNHALLRFNNLTGHLYVFKPEWLSKNKNNVIWSIPTIEIKVLKNCLIKLNVRTFTSTKRRNKITFTKKKFEEYPKYILSSDNSMRRKTDDDSKETPDFILRQVDGKKSRITFLDISSKSAYGTTKVGILTDIVDKFNSCYSGMAEIEFQTINEYSTIDTKFTARENEQSVKAYLADKTIRVIDCVKNGQSEMFCENIVSLINEKYECNAKVGSRLSKKALNIRLIHNKEYYEDKPNDPHQADMNGFTVQHITFEDFSHDSKHAVSTVIHELIIKEDVRMGAISLFDWSGLGFSQDVAFVRNGQLTVVPFLFKYLREYMRVNLKVKIRC